MKNKMQTLINKLNEASNAYYNGEPEIMTNFEWDAAFDELKALEEETGIILPNSPTNKVSEDTTEGNKVTHRFPALSLAKTKSVDDLKKWAGDKNIWLSWKLDGLTLVATYNAISETEAVLTTLATRGNGIVGTDVTRLAPYIAGLPTKIPFGHNMVVRGEALISYQDFDEVNKDNVFANPRNMASGSMTLLDTTEFANRRIHFVAFTLVNTTVEITSWGDRMNLLESLGFEVVERTACNATTIEDVVNEYTRKVNNNEYKYPVDGLVIAYDDTVYAEGGSVTGHHATRGGYAFKWADESVETELEYIEWSGSTNSITPIAVFKEVEILGSTVRRASLHNISECRRLNIGGKGSKLEVIKANMIIPQVIKVTETVGTLEIPTTCPVCGHPTQIVVSDSGTETLVCTNDNCTAKSLSMMKRFVSKAAMDIDGLSEATINTFVNAGFITTMPDIFRLDRFENEIKEMDGFGKKSVDNLIKALNKAKTVDADKFLFALNIPMCGRDVSKKLMNTYTFVDFIKLMETTTNDMKLSSIDGMGTEKSKAIYKWFKNTVNMDMVKEFMSMLTIKDIKKETISDGKCTGYTFVVTGNVYKFKNRDELKAYIEAEGGKVAGSVSAKTSFLINNDSTSTSGKNKKAKELGIPIITEDEFIAQF